MNLLWCVKCNTLHLCISTVIFLFLFFVCMFCFVEKNQSNNFWILETSDFAFCILHYLVYIH